MEAGPSSTEGRDEVPPQKNDPDGSPLEGRDLPCGLFLPPRTCPSGPWSTLKSNVQKRKTESQFAANLSEVAMATYRKPSAGRGVRLVRDDRCAAVPRAT
jgi:hypothetical protein